MLSGTVKGRFNGDVAVKKSELPNSPSSLCSKMYTAALERLVSVLCVDICLASIESNLQVEILIYE